MLKDNLVFAGSLVATYLLAEHFAMEWWQVLLTLAAIYIPARLAA
jgi:hypothetical protein